MSFRVERDPLGEFRVPADAYYGVQTARARENFPISGLTAPASLVRATILVKRAAAEANRDLERLEPRIADAIIAAADEMLSGKLLDQFVVDVYQAGAGTSHNMNANEVLANRAAELLGGAKGQYDVVHPNDHVNMGQSTNDVFPTATRLALSMEHPAFVDGVPRARLDPRGQGRGVRPRAEGWANASAGRGADHARPGVRRLRGVPRVGCGGRRRRGHGAVRAQPRRDRRRHGIECRRRLHGRRDRGPRSH